VILRAHGIAIELPAGWEGRIYRRDQGDPTLHAASFALPRRDGDFGTEATSRMPPGGTFIVLTEYRPGGDLQPGTGLFKPQGLPLPLDPRRFSPRSLVRARPGQSGFQHFFTHGRRPFCLYAVMRRAPGGLRASAAADRDALHALNRALTSVQIAAS
jgi:hypothetical protein